MKIVFWNIEWFLSYMTFYPQKKVAGPLIRVDKKISLKLGIQGIKRSGILRWFKNGAEVSCLAKGRKKIYRKTEFLRTWKILQKIVFLRKNLWELPWRKSSTHFFENSAKFCFFWYPFAQVWRNFFSTLIRAVAVFF